MQSPELRDRGLNRVRRLTIWLGGGAVLATGVLAGWFGRPQPTSATTVSDPATDVADPSTSSTPSTTTPRRPVTPPVTPPRPGGRRPGASSGGS